MPPADPAPPERPAEPATPQAADEVDRVLAAWARERPDLDLRPLAVLSRVSRLSRHLDAARRRAFDDHGLELWEFDVLAALRREGPPYELSPGQLLRETLVTSGTMTNRVDRLATRGLVERRRDTGDRRVVRVRLTDAGRRAVDGALDLLLSLERPLLTSLPQEEWGALATQLRSLLVRLERADPPPT